MGNQIDHKVYGNYSNILLTTIKNACIAYGRRTTDQQVAKRYYKHVGNELYGSVATPQLLQLFIV